MIGGLARRFAGLLALAAAFGTGSLVLAAVAGARGEASRPSWRAPQPGDPVRGKDLAATCMACHSYEAAGGGVGAPKLRGQREAYLFNALVAYRSGTRRNALMRPLAAGLTDQDARDLAAFLAGPFPDHVPPKANTDHPAYKVTSTTCTWCHGQTGLGEYEGMPVLTGQDPAYLAKALAAYRSGERQDPTMRGIAAHQDPANDAALADYYSAYAWVSYE